MKLLYRIEIDPHPSDDIADKDKPYFWRLSSINRDNPNSKYCTVTGGWSETPEKAFEDAHNFYKKYKEW